MSTLVVTGKTAQRMAATAGCWPAGWRRSGRQLMSPTVSHHRARQATFGTVVARDRARAIASCARWPP